MSVDNPYYFNNVGECSKSPQSPGRGTFSFFRKKSSTSKLNTGSPSKGKVFPSSQTPSSDTVSLGGSRRGSHWSLNRSKSSTSSSVPYSQGVILGECRPCQPNPTHFRHRLGSYNESISYGGSDDVFLPDHRHNNFHTIDFHIPRVGDCVTDGSSSSGLRRHSIGTFTQKERTRCGSFSDEVPKMPAPKPPTSSNQSPSERSTLRKGSKCSTSGRNMDDILIVTTRQSESAILWANHLKTRFDKITKERGRIPFNFLHVKIEDGNLSTDIVSRCLSTKLQIVIICPSLLALPHSQLMAQLSAILRPEKVLGLLLEIDEKRVLDIHQQALPNFKQWKRCVVRNDDQSFVGKVLGIATDILGAALRDQPLSNSISSVIPQSCHDAFTVLPKKLRVSQNKVVALLTEPLKREDTVIVKIEKSEEILEVSGIKRRNPYTLQFNVPESCMEVSMMIKIHIEKNGLDLGSREIKCESRLRELEQILKGQESPIEFVCQSLGISTADRERLDLNLVQAFQKNIPPNFHLLSGEHSGGFLVNRENSPEEYPTLLHFAAKWGLEKLSMQLLDCPGGDVATSIRNVNGKTPLDLAELKKHTKLVEILKNFTQMHEFTTMYHYFKGITDSTTNKVIVDLKSEIKGSRSTSTTHQKTETPTKVPEYMEMTGSSSSSDHGSYGPVNAVTNLNYINVETKSNSGEDVCDGISGMRVTDDEVLTNELRINEPAYYESKDSNKTDDFSQECSNLLESVVVDCPDAVSDYLIHPSNRPVTLLQKEFPNYLTHPSNRPVEASYVNDAISSPNAKTPSSASSPYDSHMRFTFKRRDDGTRSGTLKRQGSDTSKVSVDEELLEIINDFKNNVFTINEVEQLVSAWRNRNDVQQSYKDKQQQLKEMRDEYERLQSRMKETMKSPTPFERFKRLFTRSKSQDKREREASGGSTTQRPISSLSLQSVSSSSSSGRMSTGSVCSGTSLGDSGTHSDHEDRRQMYNCRVGVPGSLMENYSVPPAPRVVSQPPDHHYVIFPSNLPVYGSPSAASPSDASKSFNHDYLNFNGLNTIEEAKETDFPVTVQPIKIQRSDTLYSKSQKGSNDLCTSFRATTPPATNGEPSQDSPANAKETPDGDVTPEINLSEIDLQTQTTIRNFNRTIKECNEDLHRETCAKVQEHHQNHDYINIQLNS
ncbi:phosphoinositide 3-kinase adapter protein 1 isoform X2 [Phlebotomus papatasi]|uniref:phosphoinositide 3-kinase adapter protein 1 isoform X2 n=1 Tax=Phlebotomus papatasi TaxID=29031 RepID=UPI002484105F|nr:phosphoinositide 3-kinase adapter protein 1 isoform X2 [Phlebotomus papatasi]XP_055698202.1 phosphoinositide 3-kinase adapter protein 1 isoform X2 [Phlebotomus papatasi]XP_055698203.1 phosphoinositide 3-kinase adapter protein 1 isoform X2 [Phlebotomus papatasi]